MQMAVSFHPVKGTRQITTSHRGEELHWKATIFNTTNLKKVLEPFTVINGYWASLDIRRQDKIWTIYKEIYDILEDQIGIDVIGMISVLLLKMYDLTPPDEIERYVLYHGNVIYPEVIRSEYSEYDTNKKLTYLKPDYDQLLVLAVALRPMVPIWGIYMNDIKSATSALYKELQSIELLKLTWIMTCVAVNRLIDYIEESLKKHGPSAAAIMKSLGSNQQVDWILASICIRRLSVSELNANPVSGSLISNVYTFVDNTVPDMSNKFGQYFDKIPEDQGLDKERSNLEMYRQSELVSQGQRLSYSSYCKDVMRLAQDRMPNIDPMKVIACQNAFPEIFIPSKFAFTITQWVMAKTFPPEAVELVNKMHLRNLMIAAQAILFELNLPMLVCLMSAAPYNADNADMFVDDNTVRIGFTESSQILETMYRHTLERKGAARRKNPALAAIDQLKSMVMGQYWNVHIPEGLVVSASSMQRNLLYVGGTIVESLSNLIIMLGELNVRSSHHTAAETTSGTGDHHPQTAIHSD